MTPHMTPERRIVVVTYDNSILGAGEFWRGTMGETRTIRNVIAKNLAEHAFATGQRQSLGMWTAEVVE